MALINLDEREVQVWFVRTNLVSAARRGELARLLSEDERERWQRFTFEEGRHLYLVSHAFLRLVLSRCAGLAPEEWRFVRNGYGKPEVMPPVGLDALRGLCFNLTHTNGLAACAVARDREVGVDAEDVERGGREVSPELIRYCLSPVEKGCFEALPAERRQRGFFDYWTLKEAYLKARGFGLSLPVEAITFGWPSGIPHQGPASVAFGPEVHDDPRTWQLERFEPTPQHALAVALRRLGGPPLDVTCREWDLGS